MAPTEYKEDVFNPIVLHNTVGQELADILDEQELDHSSFLKHMEWTELTSVKKITHSDLAKIEAYIGIEGAASYLLNFQKNYRITEKRLATTYKTAKKCYRSLRSVESLLGERYRQGIDKLADIADFFGITEESKILEPISGKLAIQFRENTHITINEINLKGWLRRGEIDFLGLTLPSYNCDIFSKWIESMEWTSQIRNKQYFLSLPAIFAQLGVGLIYTPHLPKTVYGAVRWINESPLIQISDRENDLATCWFTLFHEIGHVLLHHGDDILEEDINSSKKDQSKRERDANSYANEYLYGGDGLRKYIFGLKRDKDKGFITTEGIAQKFNVDPLFVAYWCKKAQLRCDWSKYRIQVQFSIE